MQLQVLGWRLRSGRGNHLLGCQQANCISTLQKLLIGFQWSLSCEISAMDHCIQCNGEASQIRSKFILLSLIPFAKSPLLTISLLLMLLLSGGGGCRGDALKDCRGVDRC